MNTNYTHVVLTDEACAFINRHTFDELAIGLGPVLPDPYWNGDVVALICVAADNQIAVGWMLGDRAYRSPDEPGTWPGRVKVHFPSGTRWLITCFGASVAIDILDGAVLPRREMNGEGDERGGGR